MSTYYPPGTVQWGIKRPHEEVIMAENEKMARGWIAWQTGVALAPQLVKRTMPEWEPVVAGPAWTPFDPDDRFVNPLPAPGELVWVYEEFYEGVTVGEWVGGWWETSEHKDDVSVTHWMPMARPDGPKEKT